MERRDQVKGCGAFSLAVVLASLTILGNGCLGLTMTGRPHALSYSRCGSGAHAVGRDSWLENKIIFMGHP